MIMKKLFLLITLLISPSVFAWWGGYGPGPMYGPGVGFAYPVAPMGYGYGYGYGGYGGYMYPPLQVPSFNYTTVVQQPAPPPQVIYREREVPMPPASNRAFEQCDEENDRMRKYFKK
jgi:hypothetical protein